MSELPYISVLETLRLVTCLECAMMYAVPAALFITAREAQHAIYCPGGHTWTPAASDDESYASSRRIIELQATVSDVRAKYEAAMRRVEELAPIGAPSAKELRRRSNFLTERAEEAGCGRVLCPYCGRKKSKSGLPEHLRRRHRTELIDNPSAVVIHREPMAG